MTPSTRLLFPAMMVALLAAALTACGGGEDKTARPSGPVTGDFAMAVDAIGGGSVDPATAIDVGATVQVGVQVTSTEFPYQGYQLRLEFDDELLDMINVPSDWTTNNEWPTPPGGELICLGPVGPVEDDTATADVLVGCTGSTGREPQTSSFVGELGFFEFRCEASGEATVRLIPGAPGNSLVIDATFSNVVPVEVTQATIGCGAAAP